MLQTRMKIDAKIVPKSFKNEAQSLPETHPKTGLKIRRQKTSKFTQKGPFGEPWGGVHEPWLRSLLVPPGGHGGPRGLKTDPGAHKVSFLALLGSFLEAFDPKRPHN